MIGIGITTRNRPAHLEFALKHFQQFTPADECTLIVCDDASTTENSQMNGEVCAEYGANYVYYKERAGIAKNKNRCIELLGERGAAVTGFNVPHEYTFLFDDDCFPIKWGWDMPFRVLHKRYDIHHAMYLVEAGSEVQVTRRSTDFLEWNNCGGYCLWFSRHALEKLKGFDPRFGIYGFEHAEMSQRAHFLKLTGGFGPYISPADAADYLFSLDMDYGWLKKRPPFGEPKFPATRSSVEDERPAIPGYIDENRRVFLKALEEMRK